jgi:hypothetical protein
VHLARIGIPVYGVRGRSSGATGELRKMPKVPILTTGLRVLAVLLLAAAIVDPAFTKSSDEPLPVAIRAASAGIGDRNLASDVHRALAPFATFIDLDSPREPAAIVLAGESIDPRQIPPSGPLSIVTRPRVRNVKIAAVTVPDTMVLGLAGTIAGVVHAEGMQGTTSRIVLEQNGLVLARVEHRWTRPVETFGVRLNYLPDAPGVRVLRMLSQPLEHESTSGDNHMDFRIPVRDRRLNVLVYEQRPSWSATFVRRALEEERLFEIATLTQTSRGVSVESGAPPPALSASILEAYDLVIAAAPEALEPRDFEALTRFASVRGGTVLFLPDRRPSGRFLEYLRQRAFTRTDEVLLETAATLEPKAPPIRAAEFAVPVDPGSGTRVLASLRDRERVRPVVVAWSEGAGRMIYSGALDAWRYRTDNAFTSFWKEHIAGAAMASPPPLQVTLEPGMVAPNAVVRLTARFRGTETTADTVVSGRIIDRRGEAEPVRLWPTAESGAFEAEFNAPASGEYIVEVATAGVRASSPLIVAPDARFGPPASSGLEQIAASTGGVAVDIDHLSSVADHLRGLPRERAPRIVHPTRAAFWSAAFILALSMEWWLRRRTGEA